MDQNKPSSCKVRIELKLAKEWEPKAKACEGCLGPCPRKDKVVLGKTLRGTRLAPCKENVVLGKTTRGTRFKAQVQA